MRNWKDVWKGLWPTLLVEKSVPHQPQPAGTMQEAAKLVNVQFAVKAMIVRPLLKEDPMTTMIRMCESYMG